MRRSPRCAAPASRSRRSYETGSLHDLVVPVAPTIGDVTPAALSPGLQSGIRARLDPSARCHRAVAETRRLGIGIGIEDRLRKSLVAGPEPGAADLVRIGFTGDAVRQPGYAAGMARGCAPGKTGHGEVEAAPKEMDRARLA